MSVVRDSWTDERLDDLTERMDRGFDHVDADTRELRARLDKGLERVDGELRELRGEMNSRFDAMQRTMIIGFASIVASVIATQL